MSFDLSASGDHLYIAFRMVIEGQSVGRLWNCIDTNNTACAIGAVSNGNNANWREKVIVPNYGANVYQPSITTSKVAGDSIVALAWYERKHDSAKLTPIGIYSENGGQTWTSSIDIAPNTYDWAPCPTPNNTNSNDPGYYGDYFGSAILPLRYSASDWPWIVTAYASSIYGCQNLNELTYDQHVQAVVW